MESGIEKRWWALPTFVALGMLTLLFAGSRLGSPDCAKAEPLRGNGEILVVPIQIERDKHGLAILDTVNQTLCIYELNNMGPPHNRLRLFAARSWQYDRLLKQYNTAEPKPEQVRMLLEEEAFGKQPNLSHMEKPVKEQEKNSDVNIAEVNVEDVNVAEVNEPNE